MKRHRVKVTQNKSNIRYKSRPDRMYPDGTDQKIDREYIEGESLTQIGKESQIQQAYGKRKKSKKSKVA